MLGRCSFGIVETDFEGKLILMRRPLSPSSEDYLKGIFALSEGKPGEAVSTQDLADRLKVTPASTTAMIKRLHAMHLVEHTRYQGASLTEAGRLVALELIRHHRLLELYLVEALGYPLADAHAEAEQLEHHISEDFEQRIDALLGQPTHDPHGDPIPTPTGELPVRDERPLTELAADEHALVARVPDRDAEFLRYLTELGIVPDAPVRVVEIAPFDGPVTLELAGRRVQLTAGLQPERCRRR